MSKTLRWTRLIHLVFGESIGRAGALGRIAAAHVRQLPLVAALGVATGLAEGIGIGALIPFFGLLAGDAARTGLPHPIAKIMTGLMRYPEQTRYFILGGVFLVIITGRSVLQTVNLRLIARLEVRIGHDIREAAATRLLSLDYPFFLSTGSPRLVHLMTFHAWSVEEVFRIGLTAIPSLIGLAIVGALMVLAEWRLAMLAAISFAVAALLLRTLHKVQEGLARSVMASGRDLSARMTAVVEGARVIRLYGQELAERERFSDVDGTYSALLAAARQVSAITWPAGGAILTLAFVAILFAIGALHIPVPVAIAFMVLLARTEPLASQLLTARSQMAAMTGTIEEVEWLLGQAAETKAPSGGEPVDTLDQPICFDDVRYDYPDGSPALLGADFALQPGVATALIGPSGAGKSTIVNLITRLVEPSGGVITLGGRPLDSFDPAALRARIALAGQDVAVVQGTVAENIAFGKPRASRAEIEQAAIAAGAAGFIAQMPKGYDSPLHFGGTGLSGGQRQRIGLARALIRHPDLLILDEATNAVDSVGEEEIVRLLAERRFFRTLLVISHRPSILAMCSTGIVIESGRVVEAGPIGGLTYFELMKGLRT